MQYRNTVSVGPDRPSEKKCDICGFEELICIYVCRYECSGSCLNVGAPVLHFCLGDFPIGIKIWSCLNTDTGGIMCFKPNKRSTTFTLGGIILPCTTTLHLSLKWHVFVFNSAKQLPVTSNQQVTILTRLVERRRRGNIYTHTNVLSPIQANLDLLYWCSYCHFPQQHCSVPCL